MLVNKAKQGCNDQDLLQHLAHCNDQKEMACLDSSNVNAYFLVVLAMENACEIRVSVHLQGE